MQLAPVPLDKLAPSMPSNGRNTHIRTYHSSLWIIAIANAGTVKKLLNPSNIIVPAKSIPLAYIKTEADTLQEPGQSATS